MTQTILLLGATGMLGSQIARRLLDQPEARVRLLVRGKDDARKKAALGALAARGAEIVDGDLSDAASLDRATRGVDVIVSAVQGGPEVIIDGQVALAQAGKRNGVRRMLPSDYALDLFKATPGEHLMFNMRAQADEKIGATGIEHVHVLQGGFMEMFMPGSGTFDLGTGSVSFWGDGTRPIEVTSVDDTARMTARVALDRNVGSGKFAFAGDRISIQQAAEILEAQTGRNFKRISLGSEANLRAAIAVAQADASDPFKPVMLAYQLYMLNGQTALTGLQNERYRAVKLESLRQFVARKLPHAAHA
jgi:uncharacterized protein YbjT (DUF2867 family)